MIARGRTLRVLVVGPAPGGRGGISSVMAQLSRYERDPLPGFEVTLMPSHPGVAQRTPGSVSRAFLESRKVKRAIARTRPDVVHVLVGPRGSLSRKAGIARFADRRGCRVVAHIHSGAVERAIMGTPSSEVDPAALKKLLGAASVVATLWRGPLAGARARASGATCMVVGNAVSPAEGASATRDIDVVYVGRLAAEKGADRLLGIARGLADTGARLWVVGEPGDDVGAAARERLSEAANVELLGWVEPDEVRAILARAKVLVLPSRWEALPMSALEAMASGCVVVASHMESVRELLDGGRGVVIEAETAWSAEIGRLLADDAERNAIAERAKTFVDSTYSPAAVGEQLSVAYRESVLGDEPSPARAGRVDVLGWGVDAVTLGQALDRVAEAALKGEGGECVSLNASKVVNATRSHAIRVALWDPLLALPDGASIVWAARVLGRPIPERVAGIDFSQALLGRCAREAIPVYLLGARDDVVESVAAKALETYPGLVLAGWRDGYFTDPAAVAQSVAESGARVVLLAMTSPMKEAFCTQNRAALAGVVCVGVGGSFDVWAGRTRRAPAWMQNAGLEWLFRLSQEPRRLFWRYAKTNARFVARVIAQRVGWRPSHQIGVEGDGVT